MSAHTVSARAGPPFWREVWSGTDVSANVWLIYSGVTIAPWGDVKGEGLLFRLAGGYGGYTYADLDFAGFSPRRQFQAITYFTDLMAGYLVRFGDLTAKGFVGPSLIAHDINPFDAETLVYGQDVGVKGTVELWLNLGPDAYGSLDLSWSTAHETRSAHTRLGYRISPKISLGLEGSINVDAQAECRIASLAGDTCKASYDNAHSAAGYLDYARVGAFARYEWGTGEISASLGMLGGVFDDGLSDVPDPYLTFNWLMQF